MRRISRKKIAPAFLSSPKVAKEQEKLLVYLRRDESERRERRDGLNDDIFFDSKWRSELRHAFDNKCAFCEIYIYGDGLTLHLRPSRFVANADESQKNYYLWLAFEWRNLFYACSSCLKSKSNHFPVEGDRADFLATFDEVVKQESSLLIDPTAENPQRHLRFLHDGMVAAESQKGFETINAFALNRLELMLARRAIMDELFRRLEAAPKGFYLSQEFHTRTPHFGAVVSVLKRISAFWAPVNAPVKGTGDTFIRNLEKRVLSASPVELAKLREAIRTERTLGLFSPSDVSSRIVFRQSFIRPVPIAIEREMSSITISNFKAIDQLRFQLSSSRKEKAGHPAMMILGENSTAKSSVLAAIALALIGTDEAEKLNKYWPSLVHSPSTDRFDQLDAKPVEVRINFHFRRGSALFNYDPKTRTASGTKKPSMLVLGYGARRFFNPKIRDHAEGAAARVKTLFDPLATIPYPGEWLRELKGAKYDTVAAALRVVLALDDEDELIVEPNQLAVRANGRVTPVDALSEGYRSVFVMTVDIIRELMNHWENLEHAHAVVLIDEIETHLHPRWKMQVMTSLRSVLPRVQFIVTTHDPLCLRGMDDGEAVVLHRDGQNKIRPIDGLPAVSGMTSEQLLTSDYFGLASTTDPSMEIALATLAGDVARRSPDGVVEIATAQSTTQMLERLVIGDNPSEQIIQDAMIQYLEQREIRKGEATPALREDAVKAVLKALTGRDD
ncbi:AAA family ATPase [Pseudomonas syringae]|uniref:AAA family ATPase n=1 Tax=Pseudomonas syringae TaxID=317 RepID=UPI000E31E5BD|nr:AAA family ATPase [Pseudomonas syringae]